MNDDDRSWLARKLERWEQSGRLFNSPLIRLLINETWFRVAFVGILLLLVFMALFLPKIWPNTPKNFHTYIPVSGLDHVQAWSLKRAALKAMAEHRTEDAMQAWRGAIANTPGNPDISRGLLNFILTAEKSKEMMGPAYHRAKWLLELTETNRADVSLVVKVYEKYQFYEPILDRLGPFKDSLNPEEEAIYLKALFSTGNLGEFTNRLARIDRKKVVDPEIPLYEAAYQAGWESPTNSADARKILADAQNDLSKRILATRLLLVVSRKTQDLTAIEELLQHLSAWRADTAIDHVDYWELLTAMGRRSEAVDLAKNYPYPPNSASELIRLAEGYMDLNDPALDAKAGDLLKFSAVKFGYSEGVWKTYAAYLTKKGQWQELLSIAILIRQQPMVGDVLSAYSYFLEGKAHAALNNTPKADEAFTHLAEFPRIDPRLVLEFASRVLKTGFAEPARLLLDHHREGLETNSTYWMLMLQAAYELKLKDQMMEAASMGRQLDPTNSITRNNYAATLLAVREKPEEALRITLGLLSEHPDSVIARLNLCLALLLNQRTVEAKELLLTIEPLKLNDDEDRTYRQAWLEIHVNLQQWESAREDVQKIDRKHLLPPQIKWLEEAERRFPTNSVSSN